MVDEISIVLVDVAVFVVVVVLEIVVVVEAVTAAEIGRIKLEAASNTVRNVGNSITNDYGENA